MGWQMLEGYDAPSQTPVSENVGANPPSQEPMTEGADVPLPTQTPWSSRQRSVVTL